jgi:hypothetical protein
MILADCRSPCLFPAGSMISFPPGKCSAGRVMRRLA